MYLMFLGVMANKNTSFCGSICVPGPSIAVSIAVSASFWYEIHFYFFKSVYFDVFDVFKGVYFYAFDVFVFR